MTTIVSISSTAQPLTNIITLEQLAELYFHTTANAIYLRRFRNPSSLPPPIIIPGQRRLFWNRVTVDKWFDALENPYDLDEPSSSRRGSPPKAERMKARK